MQALHSSSTIPLRKSAAQQLHIVYKEPYKPWSKHTTAAFASLEGNTPPLQQDTFFFSCPRVDISAVHEQNSGGNIAA